jgi:hypothetical protein
MGTDLEGGSCGLIEVLSGIFLEALRETTRNLSQNILRLGL